MCPPSAGASKHGATREASSARLEKPAWVRWGDVANVLVLVNTALFILLVLANEYGLVPQNAISASFRSEGFCISWRDTLFNSHLLSFYVDCAAAAVLAALAKRHAAMSGAAAVQNAALGVLMHGLGHLSLWRHGSSDDPPGWQQLSSGDEAKAKKLLAGMHVPSVPPALM